MSLGRRFLTQRLKKYGVASAEEVVGTFSSKFWASLGPEYRHEMKLDMVKYMLSQPHIAKVVHKIRTYRWLFFEEDQNTPSSFKDVLLDIISMLCGPTRARPHREAP